MNATLTALRGLSGVDWLASSVKEHSAVVDARVSIEVLEAVSADHATCVVRSLAGVVPVGHVFDTGESPDGEVVEVSLVVDSIWRYGEGVRFFDSAHTARLELTGRGSDLLAEGGYLATRSLPPR